MRYAGKISTWKDSKGFGFITPFGGGKEIFVHINSFVYRNRKPTGNESLSYELTKDSKGRIQAVRVLFAGESMPGPRPIAADRNPNPALLVLAIAYLIIASIIILAGNFPAVILGLYWGASFLSFIAYGMDKSAAEERRWRISERTLFILSLIGGWPGALAGQQLFRHKTQKVSFQLIFWLIVAVNCSYFALIIMRIIKC